MIINNQYKVGRKIGSGNFGEIRLGKDEISGRLVAIKFEASRHENPQLHVENRHYLAIHKGGTQIGVPEVYYYGTFGKSNVLVMELLGNSLEELFETCGRKFSVSTVVNVAIQTIKRLETVHSKNIIHRDIKPENFLIGNKKTTCDIIHIVDFGLSKEYIDPLTNKHIPYREHKNLTGTARYMSINTHLGKEQSRRDDLEALCHMCLYFLRGSLPWQGLKAENLRDRYQKICEVKRTTTIDSLCDGFPEEFAIFLRYSRHLDFYETPNYGYLISLFENYLQRVNTVDSCTNYTFEWKSLIEIRKSMEDESQKPSNNLDSRPSECIKPNNVDNRNKNLGSTMVVKSGIATNQNENDAFVNEPETNRITSPRPHTVIDAPINNHPKSGKTKRKQNCCCL